MPTSRPGEPRPQVGRRAVGTEVDATHRAAVAGDGIAQGGGQGMDGAPFEANGQV